MKKLWRSCLLIFLLSVLTACGSKNTGAISFQEGTYYSASADTAQKETPAKTEMAPADDTVYMVLAHDMQNYQIKLMNLTNERQITYEYTDGTEFFDKYGEYTQNSDFREGTLAVIRRLNANDTLGALAFTDKTWDYGGVYNYSFDTVHNAMMIADTRYSYDNTLHIFSDGRQISPYDIGEDDKLTVYGVGKKVYSVVVDAGHGTLALKNTKLFEGGWLSLGTKVYVVITKDMVIDVPEGIYDFSVANDGYGDSGTIKISRDKKTTVDLNDYKGEGPKLCRVTFQVGIKGAALYIDGKKINYKKPLELKYGVYRLSVVADGYDTWSRQLVVKSPSAAIDIAMSEDDGDASDTEDSSSKDSGASDSKADSSASDSRNTVTPGSRAGSLAGSQTGGGKSGAGNSSGSSADSALSDAALESSIANIVTGGDSTDYLDTLSDLIDSLTDLNRQKKAED